MSDVKKLAQMMRELEDQIIVCMRCGMCQSVCPVYKQTGKEADVARGKLALLDGLMEAMLEDTEAVRDRLQKCLLCGSCAAQCPSGVELADIFLKARTILTGYSGLSVVKKIIFRGLLAKPKLFDTLLDLGSRVQGLFTKKVNDTLGTSCARVISPLIGNRHFRTLARTPFHKEVPSLDTPAGKSGLRAAIFTGCVIDKVFPEIAHSTLKVLEHHGVGIFLPAGQGCCGIPAIASGDIKTLKKLALHNLELFKKDQFDVMLTSCGTCTGTVKEIWPEMLTDLSEENTACLQKLADKTYDISDFIVNQLGVEITPTQDVTDKAVAYHDPCHLKKSLGVFEEPRQLINASPGYMVQEMKEADTCCGMGGSFNVQYYDISCNIGKRKRDNIVDSGCELVTTGCPACMIQMSDMLSSEGDSIPVKHFIELYAESL